MPSDNTSIVRVQCEWNGWRTAGVRLSDLQEIHWFQPSGAPRRLVHAYVSCSSIVAGELPHNCTRTMAPHRLLVCVIKTHTSEAVYAELEREANASPFGFGVFQNGSQPVAPLMTTLPPAETTVASTAGSLIRRAIFGL